MTELKECPFCRKTETLAIVDCIELEECDQFEHCDKDTYKTVVCRYDEGGCGASSGYRPTEQEAIDAWNTRHERICQKIPGKMKYGTRMPKCSECGQSLGDARWTYCPKCGCKVVDE